FRVWTDLRVPYREIKKNRRWHDGHPRHTHVEANVALLEIVHHSGGGIQPERAAPREYDRVHLLHQIHGVEEVGLPCTRGGAADVHGTDRALFGQEYGAPRRL